MSLRTTLLDTDALLHLQEDWQLEAADSLMAKMTDKTAKFPCIPAVQGHALKHFRYGFINLSRCSVEEASGELASLLHEYGLHSREYGNYTSLVVMIHAEKAEDGREGVEYYERLFWALLTRATAYDPQPWPESIPDEPSHHLWEFCYGGEPYFVYCGTPAHKKRRSRHFPYMMLAFTPRWVLRQFNAKARQAQRTKMLIRERLEAYDVVPPHPDLNLYGQKDNYEWKQYFLGDSTESPNRCPFVRNRKEIRQ